MAATEPRRSSRLKARLSSTDDDHARSTGRDARVPPEAHASKKRPSSAEQVSPKKKRLKDNVVPRADASTSKKRQSHAQQDGPRKRPKRPKDSSTTLFVQDVQKAILAKEEEYRKRHPKNDKKEPDKEEPKIPVSSYCDDGGQQGITTARDECLVVNDVEKTFNIIMGGRGEVQQHPSLRDYIILEERNPDIIRREIKQFLSKAKGKLRNGMPFKFEVPSTSLTQLKFVANYGWAYLAGKSVTYDMSTRMRKKTVGFICILTLIDETIKKKISITNRHVFYCFMDLFGSQKVSDNLIAAICCKFKCTQSSLLIVAEPKGSIAGRIEFSFKDKDKAEGDKGISKEDKEKSGNIKLSSQRIPDLTQVERIRFQAKSLVILEKKSLYHNLVETYFHDRLSCLLITGSGYPDMVTRKLIKEIFLQTKEKNFPIYAIVDPDPHGLKILLVYKFGSKKLAYDRMGMAIPNIQWVPVKPNNVLDLLDDATGESSSYCSQVTEREVVMLNNILREIPDLSQDFGRVVERMINSRQKVSLEALFSLGIEHISKEFLPPLIMDKELPQRSLRGTSPSLTGDHVWDWNVDAGFDKEEFIGEESESMEWSYMQRDEDKDETKAKVNDDEDDLGDLGGGEAKRHDGVVDVDNLGGADAKRHHGVAAGYELTLADKEALDFVKNSHPHGGKFEVVDIHNIVLTIDNLVPHVTSAYMDSGVIDAYILDSFEDTNVKSFLCSTDSQVLIEKKELFKTKRWRKWIDKIAEKCSGRKLVFIPLNVHSNHWVVVVLNFSTKPPEVQILNSLAGYRDLEKERKLVMNLQKCIETKNQDIDITKWEVKPYDVPQQSDRHSCGAYAVTYMRLWDGMGMTEIFTQNDMQILKRKICSTVILSDQNKIRRDSYKNCITEEEAKDAERKEKEEAKSVEEEDVEEIKGAEEEAARDAEETEGKEEEAKNAETKEEEGGEDKVRGGGEEC